MHAVLDVQKNRYIGVDVGGTRLKLGSGEWARRGERGREYPYAPDA